MRRVHAFVAEVAVDLEDCLETADDQAFEVEFRRDAQIAVDAQGIVVRHEGLGVGAAGDGMHHRRFDFQESLLLEKATRQRDDLRPDAEGFSDFRVHDQVKVALAVAHLFVGDAVELLRQRGDCLCQQFETVGVQGELSLVGDERVAFDLDDVSDLDLFFEDLVVVTFRQVVAGDVDLQHGRLVFDLQEACLAHDAEKLDAAADAVAAVFVAFGLGMLEVGVDVQEFVDGRISSRIIGVGVDAGRLEGFCFFDTLLNVFVVKKRQ